MPLASWRPGYSLWCNSASLKAENPVGGASPSPGAEEEMTAQREARGRGRGSEVEAGLFHPQHCEKRGGKRTDPSFLHLLFHSDPNQTQARGRGPSTQPSPSIHKLALFRNPSRHTQKPTFYLGSSNPLRLTHKTNHQRWASGTVGSRGAESTAPGLFSIALLFSHSMKRLLAAPVTLSQVRMQQKRFEYPFPKGVATITTSHWF